MRSVRIAIISILAGTLLVAAYLTLRGYDLLGSPSAGEAKAVPAGHQEIAILLPATSSEWERLVAALDCLQRDWSSLQPGTPKLRVTKDRAFVELTADVPELAVWLDGHADARLWIRWYKLSSDVDARQWVTKLARRQPAPLAILGGDTSDRALVLGRVLQAQRGKWQGADPLYLITTATADHYDPAEPSTPDAEPKLIEVYKDLSFRFSFTNSRIAEAVLDFVRTHPDLWPIKADDPALVSAIASLGNVWGFLAGLSSVAPPTPRVLYPQIWSDERYSTDLARRFEHMFGRTFPLGEIGNTYQIRYGTGDFYHPNPEEVVAVTWLLQKNAIWRDQRQLLLLPTGAERARRYLRTLVRRAPLDMRQLVVISGDSITVSTIYRDRDIAWNVLDMPVPLLFFAHRNPVDANVGFSAADGPEATATDVLLLYRDIFEALLLAGCRKGRMDWTTGDIQQRLRQLRWQNGHVADAEAQAGSPLFDALGNRRDRTGEHVIWLRPASEGLAPQPKASISVWCLGPDAGRDNAWQSVQVLHVLYEASAGR